ncbi:MAG: 5'-3' exonuclease [Actinomycetota bacterium]
MARASGSTLLVDAPSLIWRSYYALPDSIRAPDGSSINAAHGFLSMLGRLILDLRPTRVACALDGDWRPQWRVDLVEEYKAQRVAIMDDEPADEVDRQTDLIVRVLKLARVAVVGSARCEAEDIIATLLPQIRGPVSIVSGDRDLFQLVRDPDVVVLYPKRGVSEMLRVNETEIRTKYGIPGRAYADYAVLRGDPSDGLPGVPGVGEKSAAQLISKYGSLEAVVAAAEGARSGPLYKVALAAEYVVRAAKVVRMKGDCRVGAPDLTLGQPASKQLKTIARQHRLSGPVDRLLEAIAARQPK